VKPIVITAFVLTTACARPPTWEGAWREILPPRTPPERSTASDPLVRGIVNLWRNLGGGPTELTIIAATEPGGTDRLVPDDEPRVDHDGQRVVLPTLRVRHVADGRIEVTGEGVAAFPIAVYLAPDGQRLTLCSEKPAADPVPRGVGWLFSWQDGHPICDPAAGGWQRIAAPHAP
jgi:hypothetical protein